MRMDGKKYVALGSSYGAGPGLRPRVAGSPIAAGRSQRNYAHLIARRIGADLEDVTFSGATVQQLRRGGPKGRPAQSAFVTPDTALITITAGGNDVGYLPALTSSSLPPLLQSLLGARRRVAALIDPDRTDQRFSELEADLAGLLRDLRSTAPHARILLVGYLTLLPPDSVGTGALPAAVAGWGRTVAARLAEVSRAAAAVAGAEFVDVGAASVDHHAWSSEPWTRRFHYTLRGGAAYHPNQAGMQAVADLLQEQLRD